MILFKEIYHKAISLFDDPDIKLAYFQDTVRWQKIMYEYLQSGIVLFQNPTKVVYLLEDQNPPIGKLEIFEGDNTDTVTLSTIPLENSDFSCMIAGVYEKGVYDKETNTVKFDKIIPSGTQCSVEWYYGGDFASNFESAKSSTVPTKVIVSKVKDILAHALVVAWAENETNFVLDIKNLLTDTDFKLYSPANSVKSKVEWLRSLKANFNTLQNKLCWDLLSRKFTGGNFYA